MSSHILRTPMEQVFREPNGKVRWCFACRKRREFEYVVSQPIEQPSWYGPTRQIECATCHLIDADLFPGNEREWEG